MIPNYSKSPTLWEKIRFFIWYGIWMKEAKKVKIHPKEFQGIPKVIKKETN